MVAEHERATEPKRQARGERRITQILEAAAVVIAEDGYEGATTNKIAAQAGISPGSLYQYFANKDAIVRALTDFFLGEMRTAHRSALAGDDLDAMPLDALVVRALAPIIEFNRRNRAFKSLFARTDMPPAFAAATEPLHDAMLNRLAELVAPRAPHLTQKQLHRIAVVALQIVRALMPMIIAASGEEAEWLETQLHDLLTMYLTQALAEN